MMITVTNRRKSGDETVMSSISLSASRFRTLAFLRSPAGNCIRSPRAHGAPYEPRHGGEASRRPESASNRRPMVQGMVRRFIPPTQPPVPQDVVATGGKCLLLKWVTGMFLSSLVYGYQVVKIESLSYGVLKTSLLSDFPTSE
ncbi:hypothetical protein B296_00027343 [Ensete ventricosum]|uniref:Uncharacterized protein n=1 Tax=Ensete ventricosum TaxID=4639 RepID=A0A427APU7_ENSVE|nr:hypothetical protein B296_00027343 [Ensete ventricosum]